MTEDIYLSDAEAPAFIFVDKEHQGKDGKGWRQSKGEGAYVPDAPLEAAHRPVEWTGTYVIERLVEAFKTDRYCKMDRPRATGGSHPQIRYDREDRIDWNADDRPIVAGPSKEHFERMEEAFGWLDSYFKVDPIFAQALKRYAKMKASKMGLRRFCKENGCDKTTMPRRADSAADAIAGILSTCRTPIT